MSASCGLDGIDVADQIGDGYIGCSEFLDVAIVGRKICDRRCVAELRNFLAAPPADWSVRIVVHFASGQIRHMRVEQSRKGAQDAAFGLTAQSQQDEIVPGKNRVDDLRHDRVVVADDAGKYRGVTAVPQASGEILSQFVFDPPCAQTLFGEGTAAQITQRARKTHERNPQSDNLPRLYLARAECLPGSQFHERYISASFEKERRTWHFRGEENF